MFDFAQLKGYQWHLRSVPGSQKTLCTSKPSHTNVHEYKPITYEPTAQFSRLGTQASYSFRVCIHTCLQCLYWIWVNFLSSLSLRLLAMWCAIHHVQYIYSQLLWCHLKSDFLNPVRPQARQLWKRFHINNRLLHVYNVCTQVYFYVVVTCMYNVHAHCISSGDHNQHMCNLSPVQVVVCAALFKLSPQYPCSYDHVSQVYMYMYVHMEIHVHSILRKTRKRRKKTIYPLHSDVKWRVHGHCVHVCTCLYVSLRFSNYTYTCTSTIHVHVPYETRTCIQLWLSIVSLCKYSHVYTI